MENKKDGKFGGQFRIADIQIIECSHHQRNGGEMIIKGRNFPELKGIFFPELRDIFPPN